MSTAVLGATLDLVGAIVCTVTVGLGCLAKYGAEAAFGVATGLATSKLVEVILGVVTPKLAGIFANDLLVDLVGEHLGNAIVAGSARYMLTNYRVGGGSLATLTKYLAYRTEQEKVLAEKAQYERETRSPFDATSQHTFLGSIIKQVITLSTMSSSPLNIVSGLSTITGNSILALIPSASAANDVGQDLIPEEEFEEACPHLASIGAYGDGFCNPYIITDTSTMEILPDEIEGNPVIQESLEDGNIKTDSGLAKYILYCGNRTSDFGIMDTSIASEIGDSAFLNSSNNVINAVVGGAPVAGDAADFFTNQKQLANAAWISGEACVADDNSEYDWNTTKIYQRYVEDERYKESAEPGYKAKTTGFLEEYYKNNPLDNSYEGILARYSGLSKETVVATLDYIDYIKYVAQYKPEERYAFGDTLIQKVQKIIFKGESDEKVSALLQHETVYADTRNRAFIVA